MEEKDLELFLEKFRGRTVDFFRFRGNYGDSLIWHGTMLLLARLQITIQNVDLHSGISNEVLLIDGGGNFVDYYSDVSDFLTAKHPLYKEIVLLPHTINGEKQIELLRSLSPLTTIFCREMESESFVRANADQCEIYIWHDCAFYNDLSGHLIKGTGILNAFRKDRESLRAALPEDNEDISYNGYATKPLTDFLEKINRYLIINTDRLHVAIAGTLLGKEVNLYPNDYYKNKAVYDYSLYKYSNVKFIG